MLGRGANSEVLLADDPAFDRPVAIKLLSQHASFDLEIRRRFLKEARLMRAAAGDRIASVYDVGECEGRPYFVMEAFSESLGERLASVAEANPPRESILRLIDEMATCLNQLRASNIVHRDLKPSNFVIRKELPGTNGNSSQQLNGQYELLSPNERLVVVDLGLARDLRESAITLGAGTIGFMAPEQQQPGKSIDHRADIYSSTVIVGRVLDAAGVRSPGLDAVIRRGMAADVAIRFDSAEEWAAALRAELMQAVGGNPITDARSSTRVRIPSFLFWFFLGGVVMIVLPTRILTPAAVDPLEPPVSIPQQFGPSVADPGRNSRNGLELDHAPNSVVHDEDQCLHRNTRLSTSQEDSVWSVQDGLLRSPEGYPVLLRGVEWSGLNATPPALSGLESKPIDEIVSQVAMLGFNTIRIPFDPIILTVNRDDSAPNRNPNQAIALNAAVSTLDCVIASAAEQGLAVIFAPDPSNSQLRPSTGGFNEQNGMVFSELISRYRDRTNVIGVDIGGSANNSGCWSCRGALIGRSSAESAVEELNRNSSKWIVFTPNPDISSSIADQVVWAPRVDTRSVSKYQSEVVDQISEYVASRPAVIVGIGAQPASDGDRTWVGNTLQHLELQGQFGFVLRSLHTTPGTIGGILAPDGYSVNQQSIDTIEIFLTGPFRPKAFTEDK